MFQKLRPAMTAFMIFVAQSGENVVFKNSSLFLRFEKRIQMQMIMKMERKWLINGIIKLKKKENIMKNYQRKIKKQERKQNMVSLIY